MALPPWWMWVWASFGSWWWTGKPGVLQSMGLRRVGPNWTELNWILTDSFGHNFWQWLYVQRGKFDTEADPCTYWHFGVFCLFFFFLASGRFRTSEAQVPTYHLLLQPLLCMCLCSAVSDSLWFYELWPTRLCYPWNFLGKNTGMSCYFLLQGIFLTQGSNLGLLLHRQILYHLSHPLDVSFMEQSIKLIRESHREERRLEHMCHSFALQKGSGMRKDPEQEWSSVQSLSRVRLCDPRLI